MHVFIPAACPSACFIQISHNLLFACLYASQCAEQYADVLALTQP
jgi:hypothetical protein